MSKSYTVHFNLNKFLRDIKLKKQYIRKLKKKIFLLSEIKEKNYKTLDFLMLEKVQHLSEDHLIVYIIDISFSRTNTLLHVMDFSGNLKFFCSAGSLNYKGKRKKVRVAVFKKFYYVLVTKLKFLKNKPIALHLKNVGSNKFYILKKLKKKFFIKVVCSFNVYPYNGCRKKKVRRKKEEMAEWFKAADCKSVEFSHRRFKSCFLHYLFKYEVLEI